MPTPIELFNSLMDPQINLVPGISDTQMKNTLFKTIKLLQEENESVDGMMLSMLLSAFKSEKMEQVNLEDKNEIRSLAMALCHTLTAYRAAITLEVQQQLEKKTLMLNK